jgi:hypothetical protein
MGKKVATERRAQTGQRGRTGPVSPPPRLPAWEGPSRVWWGTPRVGESSPRPADPKDPHSAAQRASIARIAQLAGEHDPRDAAVRASDALFSGATRPVLFWLCVEILIEVRSAREAVARGVARAVAMRSGYIEEPLDEFCKDAQKILPNRPVSEVRDIASLLLQTRRAQVSTAHHVDLAIIESKLQAAQSELKRWRWAATKVRQRARIRVRKDNPHAPEATIHQLVESDPSVLEARGLHFFSFGIRESYADRFNGSVTGLSTPQSKIGADWRNSFVPLVIHELRFDAKLELEEIAELLERAQLVRVSREGEVLTLDYVSKVLSRSKYQR